MRDLFVHESAYIDRDVEIGTGSKVWHFSHIMQGARVGERCTIGQNVLIGPSVVVGSNVKIQNNVSVYGGVLLEDDVFCGPSCVFTNVDRPRSEFPTEAAEYQKTYVGRGASIGANATIVCGHTLGEYSFVGAGSVVTRDVPAYAIAYGNPARVHGWICRCGMKLCFEEGVAVCSGCERRYRRSGDTVELGEESG